jgi:hypothetical protein
MPSLRRLAALSTHLGVVGLLCTSAPLAQTLDDTFTSSFNVEAADWTSTGRSPYFVLEPGFQQTFSEGENQLVITVLAETKVVAGVETRVVEENETKAGKPFEVSRNYFAMSKRTSSVFYFGEDVDMYANGKVVNHQGSWLAGAAGATYGLMMPGLPLMKARYYQEVAPRVAMDRAEIVSVTAIVRSLAGEFKNCVKTEETSQLEPRVKEYKFYAPGVGLVKDGPFVLVKYGKVAPAAGAQVDVTTLGPQPGAAALDFSLNDQAGRPRTLTSVAGPKGTMLVFFRSADW